MSVYPFASIYLPFASVYLSASIIYLSICMHLSIASICVCLPLPLCLSGPVCLSAGRSTCLSVGRESLGMSVCGLSVCGQSVCVRVCDYAAKPFCAASYFLGAAPSKSPVKQHSDTNHSANVGQGSAGTFRSSAEVSRSVTASAAVDSRVRPQFLIKGKPQTGLWTHGASILCV